MYQRLFKKVMPAYTIWSMEFADYYMRQSCYFDKLTLHTQCLSKREYGPPDNQAPAAINLAVRNGHQHQTETSSNVIKTPACAIFNAIKATP